MSGPHSRACGYIAHPHGRMCSTNCPTCHGLGLDDRPHTVDEAYDLTPAEFSGELLSVLPTGVIIGVSAHITSEQAAEKHDMLERRFPGVRFAVISGCSAVALVLLRPGGDDVSGIPRQYTIKEAAKVARRTPKAMRQLHARRVGGEKVGPRFRKVDGRLLVDEAELVRWLGGDPE